MILDESDVVSLPLCGALTARNPTMIAKGLAYY